MNQEFVFETLLFYKSSPCYYKIYRSEDVFYGIPSPHHYYVNIEFPHFIVTIVATQLLVKGVTDGTLVGQIKEEFTRQLQTMNQCKTPDYENHAK